MGALGIAPSPVLGCSAELLQALSAKLRAPQGLISGGSLVVDLRSFMVQKLL